MLSHVFVRLFAGGPLNSNPLAEALREIIANSDWRHGLNFDRNQEVTLVRGVRPLTDFN